MNVKIFEYAVNNIELFDWSDILEEILPMLGKNCHKLLLSSKPGEELAQWLEYSSAASVKNAKSKCLKKLRELLANNSSLRNLLLELGRRYG